MNYDEERKINKNSFICSLAVSVAFFLIGLSFLFLYVIFRRTFNRINPFTNVNLIQKEAFKYIAKVSRVAKELADLSLKQPDLPAGYVTNTSFGPAEKDKAEGCVPELLEKTVVRASVVPEEVYVPIPTSHSVPV